MKFVVLSMPGDESEHLFLFPDVLTTEQFVNCVGCVRMGDLRNWERSWRKATIVSEGQATPEMLKNRNQNHIAKYISFKDEEIQHIVVFPKTIDHDRMFEGLHYVEFDVDCANLRERREWYGVEADSAGFVNAYGQCYGQSQTLGIESKGKEDTTLLLSMM